LALVASPLAAGCGDDTTAATSATPAATDAGLGPPKSSGGVCERTTADKKSLPEYARITVERFVAAVDDADGATMRALLDPSGAGPVLADLQPVTRLGLLELQDRY
jgi:hypothetical protein